jgi:hypothetical protein
MYSSRKRTLFCELKFEKRRIGCRSVAGMLQLRQLQQSMSADRQRAASGQPHQSLATFLYVGIYGIAV